MPELDNQRLTENVLASTVLMKDHPMGQLDALYIPGLSSGMIESSGIFTQTAQHYIQHDTPISFNGSDGEQFSHNIDGDDRRPVGKNPGQGWPGKNWYIEQLISQGVDISMLYPTGPGYHTRHEIIQLVDFSKKQEWKRVGITSVAWHYPLLFTMLVDEMRKADYFIAAYAIAPEQTDWYYPIKGSQGLEDTYPLVEAIKYFPRVLTYQDRGLASNFPDMFRYLKDREHIANINSW